ncbi:glycosyltransferase [Paenibacillus sp. NPDC101420]|uniref:glycosyltransferase n=1 Tax=Paenibacillus sp. NPDC101420 TaxID=3390602 RepID=UPI003D0189DE
MRPRISLVVPIYKVEDCLDRCVQSLINQTYSNIEIILVNDGSPDNCPMMCDYFANRDQRVKVIHKKNGGLSEARNYGMNLAIGEYVLFVDSDDYIELDTCEKFVEIINNNSVDVIVGSAKKIEYNSVGIMHHSLLDNREVMTGKKFLIEELKENTMHMAVWLNMYKREFLLEHNLKFKIGLLHEDEQFTPRVFLKANSVISTNIIFYNYVIRDSSITRKGDLSNNGVHIVQTCHELSIIYDELKDIELRQLLNDNLVMKYLSGFKMGRLFRRKYKNLINKRFLLNRAYSRKNKIQVYFLIINKHMYYMTYKFFSLLKS